MAGGIEYGRGVSMTGLRWGILGLGGIANAFTRDLIANGMIVAAVGSRSQEKAKAFAAEHGVETAFGSYENLAVAPDVDAIYIATPHPFHAEAAALAIKAGKHVLVEKPITLNAREAACLKDLGEAHNVIVLEAMWTRFLPHMVRIRQILAEGTIGAIRAVFAAHTKVTTDTDSTIWNSAEVRCSIWASIRYPSFMMCSVNRRRSCRPADCGRQELMQRFLPTSDMPMVQAPW
jgi:predicted dehydrogenase